MPTNVKKNVMKLRSYETLTMEKPVVGSLFSLMFKFSWEMPFFET